MRHLKRGSKLGLKKSHRDALIKQLIASLVIHERLQTTKARAKALSSRFDRMMSLVHKKDKREAIRLLPKYCAGSAEAKKKIVEVLKERFEKRTSGLTRIIPVGMRKGDNAKLVSIELV